MNTVDFGYEKVSPAEKTARVRGVFDSVADNYDLMNDLMSGGLHRLWKRFALAQTGLRPGQRALYGLTHLPRTYPCAEIDAVCARMLQAQCFSYAAVRRALERKAALSSSTPTTEALSQSGPEIRALTDYATFWDTHTQRHSTTPNESEDNSNANVYP